MENESEKKMARSSNNLRGFLLGDIWTSDFLPRHIKLLSLILAFVIFYIHNRYASQKDLLEIDRLKLELTDIKYDALTRSSELLERSRQSRIEEYIKDKESNLRTSTQPPFFVE